MTASVWDQVAGALGDRLADDLRDMVRAYDAHAERSQQTHIGPSEVGNPCTRCLARHVLGVRVQRQYDDPWCAIIGTAVHSWLDEAAVHANLTANRARWYPEVRVHPDDDTLPVGGKSDLYDEETATVIDHKVVGADRLRSFKLNGPGLQYRRQAHLYGLGYTKRGHEVDHVAVAFWNRGGRLRDLWVWTEPYNEALATEALDRFRTIRDLATTNGEAILPHLPADPDCRDCGGQEMSGDTPSSAA